MDDHSLDDDLLRALRSSPGSGIDELADAVGLPRTNFGRPLGHRLRRPIDRLSSEGLIEADADGRFRLSLRGRRRLAQRAYGD